MDLPIELRNKIVSRHRSGEGYQKMSAALKVPKNTVASIILKWKKFGTPKTLPGAGSQTEQLVEKSWVEGSPSNGTMTLSTQPRQRRIGFGTNL